MKTLQQQILPNYEEQLTLFQEDFPASLTHLPDNEKVLKTSAIYGRTILERFERFNRPGLLAKTFVGLLIGQGDWSSSRSKLIWKMKGTKSSRFHFQLARLTPRTKGKEYGSLLITPTTKQEIQDLEKFQRRMKKYKNGTTVPNLATQVMDLIGMLPTPTASEASAGAELVTGMRKKRKSGQIYASKLIDLARSGMLPTPLASDCGKKNTGLSNQESLTSLARQATGEISRLSPQFVLEMMGFPPNWTELPFLNGENPQLKPEEMR